MKKLHFQISGMHCDGCVGAIRDALGKVDGVTTADVQLNEADVTIDESACGMADVLAAIRGAGAFEVTGFTTKDG